VGRNSAACCADWRAERRITLWCPMSSSGGAT